MMKSAALLVVGFVVAQVACAAIKPVVRTLADVASLACEELAAQNVDQLKGLSAKDWCAIERNLEPFVDALLAAKQQSGLGK